MKKLNSNVTKKDRALIKAEIKAESKKRKLQKCDGLGAYEVEKIRKAMRVVWQRSHARKLAVLRSTGEDGFSYCELCKVMTPKIKIDHIEACGVVDAGFIERLFCPSSGLQAICNECHNKKTKEDRKKLK